MKFAQAILLSALFLLVSAAHVNGYLIATSTFDSGFAGGNPSDYTNSVDRGTTSGNIVAPPEFIGDRSSLEAYLPL